MPCPAVLLCQVDFDLGVLLRASRRAHLFLLSSSRLRRVLPAMRVVVSQVSFEHLSLPEDGPSTVILTLSSNEEDSAPLGSAKLARATAVVTSVTATLPSLNAGLQLQLRLPGGEEGPVVLCTTDLLALGVGAPGVSEGRLLKVPLQLAGTPPAKAPAAAAPPAKGKGAPPAKEKAAPPTKGAAPAADAAPAAECSFSCFWRVEPDFPDVSLHRCPPLAVKYFGSAFRDELRSRQSIWREELRRECGEDNPGHGTTRRYVSTLALALALTLALTPALAVALTLTL